MKDNFESERLTTVLACLAGVVSTAVLVLPAWVLIKDDLAGNELSSYCLIGCGFIAAYCLITSVMVCNIWRAVLGLLFAVVAVGLGIHSSWWAIPLYSWLFIAMIAGLIVATHIYKKLQSRRKKKPSNEKQVAKCAKCHAKSFCPYQPGGIMDEYKT